MKKLISFIALSCCISINAAERSCKMDFDQTVDYYGYRQWEGRGVAFSVDEYKGIFCYTQDGDFDIELYNGAIETASYKDGFEGVKMPVDIYSMRRQIILYNIRNDSTDGCPPGFSRKAIEEMPKGKYFLVGSYSSEKPTPELTEIRLSRIIDDEAKPGYPNMQTMDTSVLPSHYTGIMVTDELILDGDAANKAEWVRKQVTSGDGGRLHKYWFSLSITQRTDDATYSSKSSDSKSLKVERTKGRKTIEKKQKSSNPFAGGSSDYHSDDE